MKKFLFFLLLLILIGGTGFFFGWTHLTVPAGSYGVMRSKTHGLDSRIIRDGEFRWIWYKLIPKNVKISVYTLGQVKRSFKNSGNLNSGQTYAALAGVQADFSWEISGELSFSLKPEILPELTARENISDDTGLRRAEEALAGRMETFALQRIKSYTDGDDEEKMKTINLTGSLPELNSEIQAAFPEIENLTCTINVVRYPDYILYQSVKTLYREYIARQKAVLSSDIANDAGKRTDMNIRMDELAKYGELLVKYPILLKYLAIEKGFPEAADPEISPKER